MKFSFQNLGNDREDKNGRRKCLFFERKHLETGKVFFT